MKIQLSVIALLLFGCINCTKDSYNTAPDLKFLSVNATVFPQPSTINFSLQCTDKEGDVVDTIWIQRISRVTACGANQFVDSFPIPDFQPPKDVKAEFDFTFNYGNILPPNLLSCSMNNDTCYFRFWMHDQAQHVSDTAVSPDIVLLKQ